MGVCCVLVGKEKRGTDRVGDGVVDECTECESGSGWVGVCRLGLGGVRFVHLVRRFPLPSDVLLV